MGTDLVRARERITGPRTISSVNQTISSSTSSCGPNIAAAEEGWEEAEEEAPALLCLLLLLSLPAWAVAEEACSMEAASMQRKMTCGVGSRVNDLKGNMKRAWSIHTHLAVYVRPSIRNPRTERHTVSTSHALRNGESKDSTPSCCCLERRGRTSDSAIACSAAAAALLCGGRFRIVGFGCCFCCLGWRCLDAAAFSAAVRRHCGQPWWC